MEALIILLILIVIWIYYHFNHRIQYLENEITVFKNQIHPSQATINPIDVADDAPILSTERTSISIETPFEHNTESTPSHENHYFEEKINQLTAFIKQNILSIIGIFTLVLGIGYFVKYAIDKNWIGELGRVVIGASTGFLLIGIGHWLRKNYTIFASIITGGGISIFYLTVTIAFQEYHLFSQSVTFGVLCLITVGSIVLAHYYKSEVLNCVALIGGFLAPFMVSTGESNYILLFTYLSLLNLGMLVISYQKKWKTIGWFAFILSTIYCNIWVVDQPSTKALYFFVLFYILFYAFALQSYFKKKSLAISDILMLVLTNFFFVCIGTFLLWDKGIKGFSLLSFGFAVINAIFVIREKNKSTTPLSYAVFVALTISLFSIAIALELDAYFISIIWAIEASLLLFLWKKTNQTIFKRGFVILFPFVIIALIYTWINYENHATYSIIFNPIFLTSLVVISTLIFNILFLKKSESLSKELSNSTYIAVLSNVSFCVIYFAILLELRYHIQLLSSTIISTILLIFSIYYVFTILILRQKLNLKALVIRLLIGLLLAFSFVLVSTTNIHIDLVKNRIQLGFYILYILYWLPILLSYFQIIPKTIFIKTLTSVGILAFIGIYLLSFEIYHLYIILTLKNAAILSELRTHYIILYLPIIWTIIAASLIYFGIKKAQPLINKIGFGLFAITILKFYGYDIWQLDNVSRIIAFILLGILLLCSSFLFQRLKRIIVKIVEPLPSKEKNN